jgi:protein-tyrosine phosphatase
VIDLHCHVLPGIDDGPEEIEGSLALVRAAAAAGETTLVATPHVNWRYANVAVEIERLTDELARRLAADDTAMQLVAGAEIAMTHVAELSEAELSRLRLGDGPWLLLEPPFGPLAGSLAEIVEDLQRRGHGVILAHPERCAAFHRRPELLESLVRGGALTSVTAGSLVGHFGERVRRFALELFASGLVHDVSSDAHDAIRRAPGMSREIEEAGLAELTEWLTVEVPGAILAGASIPARPAVTVPRPRRGWRRLSRRA